MTKCHECALISPVQSYSLSGIINGSNQKMLKKLMNNMMPTAPMAGKQPPAQATGKAMANPFSSSAVFAGKTPSPNTSAPGMNPHHQLAAQLKSGAVKFNPDKPALPHTATKSWSA
jgi:hypothetical protein